MNKIIYIIILKKIIYLSTVGPHELLSIIHDISTSYILDQPSSLLFLCLLASDDATPYCRGSVGLEEQFIFLNTTPLGRSEMVSIFK